jgi:hypothetical protein
MPKANPVAKLLKQVNSLQIKAEKITSELSELSKSLAALDLVDDRVITPKPVKLKTQVKETSIKVTNTGSANNIPKKRGRPRKNS